MKAWLSEQGVPQYQNMEAPFKQIATDERLTTEKITNYRFALRWLEYGLLARDVLTVKPEVMAAKQRELGISGKS